MRALIVGAGFAGAVCARQLAEAGLDVVVVDKRDHVGGNAFDHKDAFGVLVHRYGPHIFHTNSAEVYEYLSRFTRWRAYEHRVLSVVDGVTYPIPINRTTVNRLYGLDLDEDGVAAYLASVREAREPIRTSEDVVLASVGRDLCEKFFRGYTRKQWGLDLSELAAGVAARIPTRTNDDDRYFTDRYQAMPLDGYACMFERMLSHERIELRLDTAFKSVQSSLPRDVTIYTGPIDEYFDCRFGRLPYRSLRFEHFHVAGIRTVQPVGTINHPNQNEYTRITEFKHLTGQSHYGSSLVKEYPTSIGEPYYPVPTAENEALFKKYQALADAEVATHFVGRLAQYRYYNMDQVVAAALSVSRTVLDSLPDHATVAASCCQAG